MINPERDRQTESERKREMVNHLHILSHLESDLDKSKIETDRQTERERESSQMLSNLESDLDESTMRQTDREGKRSRCFNLLQILSNLESDLEK